MRLSRFRQALFCTVGALRHEMEDHHSQCLTENQALLLKVDNCMRQFCAESDPLIPQISEFFRTFFKSKRVEPACIFRILKMFFENEEKIIDRLTEYL